MSSLTLAIPADLKTRMKRFPEINWSEVARQAISEKTSILGNLQRVFSKSTLTEADAIAIGREIKKHVWKKQYKHLAK